MDIASIEITRKLENLVERAQRPAHQEASTAQPPATQPVEATDQVPREVLEQAARDIALNFEVRVTLAQDESTGRDIVRIYDQDSQRLIRQIPPKAALKILDRLHQGHGDILVNSLV